MWPESLEAALETPAELLMPRSPRSTETEEPWEPCRRLGLGPREKRPLEPGACREEAWGLWLWARVRGLEEGCPEGAVEAGASS